MNLPDTHYTDQDRKKNVVCACSGTTQAQIEALIGQGIDNLDRISRITGACSGCGACEPEIMQLLAACAPPVTKPNAV